MHRWRDEFHERQLILLLFPMVLGLSWIRSLHRITPYSALANTAVLLGIGIVMYYAAIYVRMPKTPTTTTAAMTVSTSWRRLSEFYGT
jgi:hypothetical protein